MNPAPSPLSADNASELAPVVSSPPPRMMSAKAYAELAKTRRGASGGNYHKDLGRLLGYLKPYWHIVAGSTLCTAFVTLAKLGQASFIGKIFKLMTAGSNDHSAAGVAQSVQNGSLSHVRLGPLSMEGWSLGAQLNAVCGSFVVMMLGMGLATYTMRYLSNLAGQRAWRDLRNQVFQHLQGLPLSFFDTMRGGEIQSRSTADVTLATAVFIQLGDVVVATMFVIIALSYMLFNDPKMTATLLLLAPVMGVAIGQFGSRIGRLTESIQTRGADLSSLTYEGITSVKGIKAFGLERQQTELYEERSADAYNLNMKLVSVSAVQSPAVDVMTAMGIMALVWLGAQSILSQKADLGQMAEYWSLLVMTMQPINQLSVFWSNFQGAAAAGGRVFAILDEPTEAQRFGSLPDLPAVTGSVEFQGVTFGYAQDKQVLKALDLRVQPGEVVAIVGSNGAGKSTLINLLARFYDPQSGQVSIDGHDLKSVNPASIRRQIGLVTQESILLAGTIRDNIAMGQPGSSDREIEEAARLANAHDFIERMPQGYATEIGERGARLSGGQRQRIAIARALLRNPRILVLDEFTSGIDPESELLITDAIEKSLAGRTCFVIAHRYNTIRHASRILVMHEGEVIQQGTHDQLIEQEGLYRRIYQAQLKPRDETGAAL